jgi:Family of unknown function (DUF5996)
MNSRETDREAWPDLPYRVWKDTCATLQLWTQIVGKIRLSQTPWLNHSSHVTLYVTARGLTTSPIPFGERVFQIDFDFIDHLLRVETSNGAQRQIPLRAQPVADFYTAIMATLADLGMRVKIGEWPNEVPNPIRFSEDRAHAPPRESFLSIRQLRIWHEELRLTPRSPDLRGPGYSRPARYYRGPP